ncbi:hypothetical protein LINPERHAP2_LOCUS40341 [Linum perenne]
MREGEHESVIIHCNVTANVPRDKATMVLIILHIVDILAL